MRKPKKFEIQFAAKSLRNFDDKDNGERTYWSPGLYTREYCKKIIDAVSDAELQAAGIIDIKEVRRLAGAVR